MALPTFAPGTGPFGKAKGHWTVDPAGLSAGRARRRRQPLCALVTETCLSLAGAAGPVIVEGPFARNRLFLAALAQRIPRPILAEPDATGTVDGAVLLALGPDARPSAGADAPAAPLDIDFSSYARSWREQAGHGQRATGGWRSMSRPSSGR